MSRVGDIQSGMAAAIAVDGTSYDLSAAGRVQVGYFAGPPTSGAFVAISPGDIATAEGADLTRWSYRVTTLIQCWAPSAGSSQTARIEAAHDLQSQVLGSLHGAFVDPATRATAMATACARDVQVSSTVLAGELVHDAWAGWGYVEMAIAYTIDGGPGVI